MLKHTSQLIAAGLLAALLNVAPFAGAAHAVGEPKFGEAWIAGDYYGSGGNALPGGSPQATFRVTRENSDEPFSTLVPDEVKVSGSFYVSMKKGYIAGIDLGYEIIRGTNVRDRTTDGEYWRIAKPSFADTFNILASTAELPPGLRDRIIASCNGGGLSDGEAHFDFPLLMQVKARRYKRGNTSANKRRDKLVQGVARTKVICSTLAQTQAPPKPISVDIRVKQKGDTCPKDTEVTAYIDYDKPMTGRFRVVHNGKQGKIIEIKARKMSFAGKTFYRIERLERYALDPGKHNFKIKVIGGGQSKKETVTVVCPPFEPTSMWLTLDTENKSTCPKKVDASVRIDGNAPGSVLTKIKNQAGVVMAIESIKVKREGNQYVGRLTKTFNMSAVDTMLIAENANDTANNSGWVPLKIECLEPLSGKLTLQSLGATSCKGEALVAIHTNGAGKLPYELECGPGRSWQRNVTAMANKIGVDKVRFDVTNNEQVTCVLRTRIGGVLKSLDGASKTFQCHKPTDTGASTDLTPETRPEDPPPVHPTLTGDFLFVDNGGTTCPRQGKALVNFKTTKPGNVHWSLDCTNGHFSGVAQTAPNPKGGYVAPALVSFDVNQTTHAKCALKTVAPGKPKVHTLKGHIFQCVRTTGVGGADDLAPDTRPDPQKPDKPGTSVVDPVKPDERKPNKATVSEPKLTCANGTVEKGACTCEPNFKPVKAGQNAWRCVRVVSDPKPLKPTVSQPKIGCANGTVKNGVCNCDRMHKRVKAGPNAWRCVRVVADPPRNKDKAGKLKLKSGAGKPAGLKAKGQAPKKPAILLAPR